MNKLTVEGVGRSLEVLLEMDSKVGGRKIVVKDENDKEYYTS